MVSVKYTTEFTIKNGKIKTSRVIGEENATDAQKTAILAAKPLLRKFLRSRLANPEDGLVNVYTAYTETRRGLQLNFKV